MWNNKFCDSWEEVTEGTPPVAASGAHSVILLKAGAVKLQMKQLTAKPWLFIEKMCSACPDCTRCLFKTGSYLLGTAVFENQICS